MQSSQQRNGVTIAVGSALVLLVASVALAWFGVEGATLPYLPEGENEVSVGELAFSNLDLPGGSLWESTSFLDILVAICALGTIILGVRALRRSALGETTATIIAVFGIVALVLVVYVAIAPPNNVDLDPETVLPFPPEPGTELEPLQVELSRQIGVFVGIIAAAGMTIGGGLAARRGPAAASGEAPSRRPGE